MLEARDRIMVALDCGREEALELARTIELACKELRAALEDLPSFKRSHDIREHIIEVNNLEEKGDVIYFRGVHRLYTQVEDPIIVLAWDNIFAKREKCCDACEHVADVTKNIVMKNS